VGFLYVQWVTSLALTFPLSHESFASAGLKPVG